MISKNQMLRKQTQFKPNSNPNKPNWLYAQNEHNFCYNKQLRRKTPFQPPQKQTQFKPNSNPIGSDAQNKRILCYNKELQRKPAFQPPRKQTQNKPSHNSRSLGPILSGIKLRIKKQPCFEILKPRL